jgi:hypothetical protein
MLVLAFRDEYYGEDRGWEAFDYIDYRRWLYAYDRDVHRLHSYYGGADNQLSLLEGSP